MMAASITKAVDLWNAGQLGAAREELREYLDENHRRKGWVDELVATNPPRDFMKLITLIETDDGRYFVTVKTPPS
jgi:hypothetical protein